MKVKNSYICLIASAIYIIFSFVPSVWVSTYMRAETPGFGSYRFGYEWRVNAYGAEVHVLICVLIVLLLIILGLLAMLLRLSGKENSLTTIGAFAPAVAFLLYVALAIYMIGHRIPNGEPTELAYAGYYGFSEYSVGWPFYVCTASLLIAAVLGVLMGLGKINDSASVVAYILAPFSAKVSEAKHPAECANNTEIPDNLDAIDELKKYKELLDTGVITQAEFDTKKKQLLGL